MSRNPLSTVVLFGASGELGSAISRYCAAHLQTQGVVIRPIPWAVAHDGVGLPKDVDLVIFANGITDARAPESKIRFSNFDFPRRIISEQDQPGRRYITFGTAMEHFPDICAQNPYLHSKFDLGQWMSAKANPEKYLHVKLHTLYGGALKPHMFLGQMAMAIRTGSEFRMSAGNQLREYHHVDDVAASLGSLILGSGHPQSSAIDISSGQPLKLSELAKAVFKAFGKDQLLKIGSLTTPKGENLGRTFERSPSWLLLNSRPPLPGIIDWLKLRTKE